MRANTPPQVDDVEDLSGGRLHIPISGWAARHKYPRAFHKILGDTWPGNGVGGAKADGSQHSIRPDLGSCQGPTASGATDSRNSPDQQQPGAPLGLTTWGIYPPPGYFGDDNDDAKKLKATDE